MIMNISTPNMMLNPMKALKERRAKRNSEQVQTSVVQQDRDPTGAYDDDDTMPPPPPPMVASKSDSFLLTSIAKLRSPKSFRKSNSKPANIARSNSSSTANSESTQDANSSSNNKSTKNAVFPSVVVSSSSVTNSKPKKGVRFEPKQDQVHRCVPRLSTITPLDKHQLWFDSQEFGDMYDECERTARKLNCGKKVKDKKYSAVGLEAWTEEGREVRTIHKEDAWDAVFEEQYVGYKQGRRVSMNVSAAYQKASEQAKLRAVEVAMGIHHDVEKFLMKNDGSLRRLLMMNSQSQDDSSLHFSAELKDEGETRRRGSM